MESLSRSVFYRIRESAEGKNKRFEPDTPLVLFILFSRIATGFAFASALLFLTDNPLSFYLVVSAFVSMILATVTSLTHLATPFRFYRVLKNPSSHLTLEIAFSSIFLIVLVLIIGSELANIRGFGKISGLFLFLTALLLLFGTTYAYRYTSHPLWNSMVFFPYYLANGFAFASFFLNFTLSVNGIQTGLVYILCGFVLILTQLLCVFLYILFLKKSSPEAMSYMREKRANVLYIWCGLNFIIPIFLSLIIMIKGVSESYFTLMIIISMIFGVYGERMLFFLLEKPVFFFNTELKKHCSNRYS